MDECFCSGKGPGTLEAGSDPKVEEWFLVDERTEQEAGVHDSKVADLG
jgi:hypothetical protein